MSAPGLVERVQADMQLKILNMQERFLRFVTLAISIQVMAAVRPSAAASDLTDVPQAWYSLNGSHVAVFQKDGDAWYAQISKSDGGEVLWGAETDRPLCGCVANDGKSIAILTGTRNDKEDRYSNLRLSVVTDEEDTFSHELAGTKIVELPGPDRESVLAIASLESQDGKPVVAFTSVGHVVGRIHVGDNAAVGMMKLPASTFAADSSRSVVAQAMGMTWKLASLATRPKISENHLVAPMSTGMLAACMLKARSSGERKAVWERLLAKLQVSVGPDYSVDHWLFGLKATGCFGWRVSADAIAPEISGHSLRHKKYVLRESPTSFWTRMISLTNTSTVVSRTQLDLATENEWLADALDEFTKLPSIKIRRFKSTDNEMSLRTTLTFAAEWAYPFNSADVKDGTFQNLPSKEKTTTVIPARYVTGAQEFCRVAQFDGRRLARVPLLNGYSVLFVLSENADEFGRTDDLLFAGDVPSMLSRAAWKEVKLNCEFPIFAVSQKLSMLDGLSFISAAGAPFPSALNSDAPMSLIDASQSALLQIDHDGVSSVSTPIKNFASISPGESLIVDRPFHVCVLADGSEFPVLIARVTSPEVLTR